VFEGSKGAFGQRRYRGNKDLITRNPLEGGGGAFSVPEEPVINKGGRI